MAGQLASSLAVLRTGIAAVQPLGHLMMFLLESQQYHYLSDG